MSTLLQLTYWQVFLAVLAQQLGLPIPSVVVLMAAGALSAHGGMHPVAIVLLGVVGCLAGMVCGSGSVASGDQRLCGCFAV
jgi:membrane protein DedA with SNARE-associated domain